MSAYGDEDEGGGGGYEDVDEQSEKKAPSEKLLPPPTEPAKPSAPGSLNCCCPLWSILWLAVLVAFAWPLSVAMAALYGFVSPLVSLIGVDDPGDSMLQAVNLGKECAQNVRTGSSPPGSIGASCLLWSLIWLAVLVAFAWPLSMAMAALYGFVSPMVSLLGLGDIGDSMLQAVNLGRECARNVRTGKSMI